MKKHLKVIRLGQEHPLCGRHIVRAGKNQTKPQTLTGELAEVECGFCLLEMYDSGLPINSEQKEKIARRSRGQEDDKSEDFSELEEADS